LRDWNLTLRQPPVPTTENDIHRMGRVWFRAHNINRLTLENIAIHDPNGYLSAWPDGTFEFEGCHDRRLINVTVNGESYK
jgi:hypothetical protein